MIDFPPEEPNEEQEFDSSTESYSSSPSEEHHHILTGRNSARIEYAGMFLEVTDQNVSGIDLLSSLLSVRTLLLKESGNLKKDSPKGVG